MKNKLAGVAKAVVPPLVILFGDLVYSLQSGKIDRVTLAGAAAAVMGSVITYFVPNAQPEVSALEAEISLSPVNSTYAPAAALKPQEPAA